MSIVSSPPAACQAVLSGVFRLHQAHVTALLTAALPRLEEQAVGLQDYSDIGSTVQLT